MALAACLLFDRVSEQALHKLWVRLEESGIPTLLSHTHGRHVPHLSLVVLRRYDVSAARDALVRIPAQEPTVLHVDALGVFRRGRCWLLPSVTAALAARQETVAAALEGTGAELHRHYLPGVWVPHCSVAPRARLADLPQVAAAVYDVLPMLLRADRAALIDSATGEQWPLPHLV